MGSTKHRGGVLVLLFALACAEQDRDCETRAEDGRCCRVECVGDDCKTNCDEPPPAVGQVCADAKADHEVCCSKLAPGDQLTECEAALAAADYDRSDDRSCVESADAYECPVN